jgi:hypothetical protein
MCRVPDILARQDALLLGAKRYYTGKPCKHGHDAERFVVNGGCVECVRAAWEKWYYDPDMAAARTRFSRRGSNAD